MFTSIQNKQIKELEKKHKEFVVQVRQREIEISLMARGAKTKDEISFVQKQKKHLSTLHKAEKVGEQMIKAFKVQAL